MWWGFALNSAWALVLLGSAAILVPRYGALGLGWAYLASYSVHAVTVSTYVRLHFRDRLVHREPTVRTRCEPSDLELEKDYAR